MERTGTMSQDRPFEVTDEDFQQQVLDADQLVLVDFWAPWCGPCRTVAPILEELAVEYAGRVRVAKVNVDQSSRQASRYGVQGIPTMVLFAGGREVGRVVGAVPKETVRARLEGALARA